jgi:tyrosyl-tRNA synthetase
MSAEKIEKLLNRGVEQIVPKDGDTLREVLQSGKKLRVYAGFDPTGEHLHLGHALQLMKLREFQDLGHEVIMLIGSFTAMIGDPTDKTSARVQLTKEQVLENAQTYQEQAAKILKFDGENPAILKFNDEWLSKLSFEDVLALSSNFTVQQMVERDMFEKRIEDGQPIYLHEFFYPLMQGYDSVAMNVDLEIGGSDQLFNMLAGRTLLRKLKNKEKYVITLKLLTNDEGKKMSKSEGGFIALNDAPEEKYGKIMAMSDSMIASYAELVFGENPDLAFIANHPREAKAQLAKRVVEFFDGLEQAEAAENHFNSVFRNGAMPENIPEFKLESAMNIVDLLVASGLASSKSEARRQLEQGAVKIDSTVITDQDLTLTPPTSIIIQKGKRHFIRVI